jgi:signal peptidase I
MIFTIVSVRTVDQNRSTIFGYKPFIVLSNSMEDVFQAGDIAISKEVDTSTLQPGDIITFYSIDPDSYGEVITHKIREVTTYEGETAYVTYGTTTDSDDNYPALASQVIGEYQFSLPKVGYFFNFLRTTLGYVCLILVPFLILICLQTVRFFRLLKLYRQEQQQEIAQERAAVEAERREAAKMMEELKQLREQLASQGAGQG